MSGPVRALVLGSLPCIPLLSLGPIFKFPRWRGGNAPSVCNAAYVLVADHAGQWRALAGTIAAATPVRFAEIHAASKPPCDCRSQDSAGRSPRACVDPARDHLPRSAFACGLPPLS